MLPAILFILSSCNFVHLPETHSVGDEKHWALFGSALWPIQTVPTSWPTFWKVYTVLSFTLTENVAPVRLRETLSFGFIFIHSLSVNSGAGTVVVVVGSAVVVGATVVVFEVVVDAEAGWVGAVYRGVKSAGERRADAG